MPSRRFNRRWAPIGMLAIVVFGCQPTDPEFREASLRLEKPMDQSSGGDESPAEVVEKVSRDRAAREAVQLRHPDLFAAVSGAMFRHDPIGINFGSNTDEYDAEAGTVIPRLSTCSSVDDVEKVLKEEFGRWFGDDIAGRARYTALANEVWRLWTERQVKS